jgi:hypothetical protein
VPVSLSPNQVRYLRLRAQRLIFPASELDITAEYVCRAICGIQAQDLPAAILAVRVRSSHLTADKVEQERSHGRLIRTWCMRGTLHLVASQDAAWLIPFLGPILLPTHRRRAEQLGWDPVHLAKGLDLLQESLVTRGPLTREEIKQLLVINSLPSDGQAPIHLIYHAALSGILCMGADRGKQPTYAAFEDWVGEPHRLTNQETITELALRYFTGYGPVTVRDFTAWSGLNTKAARQAWDLIGDLITPVELGGKPMWMLKSQLAWLDELGEKPGAIKLLPRFDTSLLGYSNRDIAIAPAYSKYVHPGGGIINRVVLSGIGMILGIWKLEKRQRKNIVAVELFEPLEREHHPGLEAEAVDLGRFLNVDTILRISKI